MKIQKIISLALCGLISSNMVLHAATSVAAPTYVTQLYAAVATQADASFIERIKSFSVSNEVYKAKLAELAAVLKGQAAGVAKPSDLYAQALLLADIEHDTATATLLKSKYEKCRELEKYEERSIREQYEYKYHAIAGPSHWLGWIGVIIGASVISLVAYLIADKSGLLNSLDNPVHDFKFKAKARYAAAE